MTTYKEMVLETLEDNKEEVFDGLVGSNPEDIAHNEADLIGSISDTFADSDTITGAGSGSFTFNREEAKENVLNNLEEVQQALIEWQGEDEANKIMGETVFTGNWEELDVIIRQWSLYEAAEQFVNDHMKELLKKELIK